jgi:glutathione-regulated potassium-efflux system protein KefB
LRAAGAGDAHLICVCVDKKETATHIVEIARTSFPLAQIYVRTFDRVHALEVLEKEAHFQIRETYESAIAFGKAALDVLQLPPERIAELETEVRGRDRERFALQQQGGTYAGREQLVTRPIPRPEPLVDPKRKGIALNPEAKATR